MTVTLRFAPSPTGQIHVGNVRTALLNWLMARKNGGTFILRLDDTDLERSTVEYAEQIKQDLQWLGLNYDRVEDQSSRLPLYEEVASKLKAEGLLYPCYETPEELSLKRKVALNAGRPPVYDRAALNLTDEDRAKLEAEGRAPHWRFKLPAETIEWDDHVQGHKAVDLTAQSDPVLIRADGSPLYTLPSVIDDMEYGVTHVVRGEDHVTNTAVQIAIIRALGGTPPEFAHHALLTGADGQGLSKRLGSLSIRSLMEDGFEALSITSLLAKLGTSEAIDAAESLDALVEGFGFEKLSRSPARFDPAELEALNAKIVQHLPFEAVQTRLNDMGITDELAEAFWLCIRENLHFVKDAADWWPVVTGPLQPVVEEAEFLAQALELLPPAPYTEESWGEWTAALKEATGRKGKALFMPLRLALTAQNHGPQLKNLLPLLSEQAVKARLQGDAA